MSESIISRRGGGGGNPLTKANNSIFRNVGGSTSYTAIGVGESVTFSAYLNQYDGNNKLSASKGTPDWVIIHWSIGNCSALGLTHISLLAVYGEDTETEVYATLNGYYSRLKVTTRINYNSTSDRYEVEATFTTLEHLTSSTAAKPWIYNAPTYIYGSYTPA